MPKTKKQWPAEKISMRRVADLVPAASNARTHTPAQIAKIAAAITEWGWTNPLLIDEDDNIIAGHGRVMAAENLDIEEVPCIVAKGWSEAQKRAYLLADNQIALQAGWDTSLLHTELQDLEDLSFDVDLIGFDDDELESLTSEPELKPRPIEKPLGRAWIMIGVPLGMYADVADQLEPIADMDGVIWESTVGS